MSIYYISKFMAVGIYSYTFDFYTFKYDTFKSVIGIQIFSEMTFETILTLFGDFFYFDTFKNDTFESV